MKQHCQFPWVKDNEIDKQRTLKSADKARLLQPKYHLETYCYGAFVVIIYILLTIAF